MAWYREQSLNKHNFGSHLVSVAREMGHYHRSETITRGEVLTFADVTYLLLGAGVDISTAEIFSPRH